MAFNRAFDSYLDDAGREERSHRIAWSAVKRAYTRNGGDWVRR
ncbi:ChaB family protein [Acuticoccus sediminis]|nr:ChaB family protein [Acuticoccus sediminis]